MRAAILIACLILAGCDRGPTDEDMAGCATSTRRVTARDVAECAVDREQIRRKEMP